MATDGAVQDRLLFANRRLVDLRNINNAPTGLHGANVQDRQQLIQEFFFHLVGSIEFLAQVVNNRRALGLPEEKASATRVVRNLPATDPIRPVLDILYPRTRGQHLPSNPYTDEWDHFRILILRHHVCHRGQNPFFFRQGDLPTTSLVLDPRDGPFYGSRRAAIDELQHFYDIVYNKIQRIFGLL
jgi:hypothetical protein